MTVGLTQEARRAAPDPGGAACVVTIPAGASLTVTEALNEFKASCGAGMWRREQWRKPLFG
jgi:hypothetical protein